MAMREQIEEKLMAALSPVRMNLENESRHHNVPKGSESHWNLIVVSDAFAGKSRIQRHRQVYAALGTELEAGIHALTFKALTPQEWDAAGGEVENPAPLCRGGSKHDRK